MSEEASFKKINLNGVFLPLILVILQQWQKVIKNIQWYNKSQNLFKSFVRYESGKSLKLKLMRRYLDYRYPVSQIWGH